MVVRLSSKNFKKLIFLAYCMDKYTSVCPSGMARQMMKIPFSAAKKTNTALGAIHRPTHH
ncbi:hypothetical protein KL86DES1_22214 [uncultured Desulfovibrio sp.]|uniref:Uncharacterized protein n=1 Tax=uncultured Desulfovibrio sp. TaxID=167968 RepID=A0A212LBD3_9BACT|nr:hypothetical protein KL86DES1_22214 [uncultured Desulfovibrio sp.]VZH35107.1 conserved protein of unknown function [Desulfovibrio sp. 86]